MEDGEGRRGRSHIGSVPGDSALLQSPLRTFDAGVQVRVGATQTPQTL